MCDEANAVNSAKTAFSIRNEESMKAFIQRSARDDIMAMAMLSKSFSQVIVGAQRLATGPNFTVKLPSKP